MEDDFVPAKPSLQ
jgi:hypothetical protein